MQNRFKRKEQMDMNGKIICIGRQYGSGGRETGERLAQLLGVICYDKLLIRQTARETGLSEEIIKSDDEQPIGLACMVSGNPFADSAALGEAFYSERERVYEAERRTILNIAAKGPCVVIGRCASAILRDAGFDVLSVFIYADRSDRLQRIMRRNDINERTAAHRLQKIDNLRRQYFDFYADTAWGTSESYDLMISTSRCGIDGAAQIIEKALQMEEETNGSNR